MRRLLLDEKAGDGGCVPRAWVIMEVGMGMVGVLLGREGRLVPTLLVSGREGLVGVLLCCSLWGSVLLGVQAPRSATSQWEHVRLAWAT